ncbi:MAG TPA: N-6 DNA methylase [Gemmatimonadaceae bacterium]
MRTAGWAEGLADAEPLNRLKALAQALGFGDAAQIDTTTRHRLGVPDEARSVLLAPGPGTTRLVGIVAQAPDAPRALAARVADRLARKAPHLLWLLVVVADGEAEAVIAAWPGGPGPVRIAALVIAPGRLAASDTDTLDALADSLGRGSDVEVHSAWIEILGREAISRRFFQALQRLVDQLAQGAIGTATVALRREVALLYVSRLTFLSFLQERGWLDGDLRFLARCFDACVADGGGFQRRVLRPLFFGTLNTPPRQRSPRARELGQIPFLNGGLFTRTAVEKATGSLVMQDRDFGDLFDQLLVRYRFTGREETPTWQEAAIDPEILGLAFESLMAAGERRDTGAFYTPLSLVTRIADLALDEALVRRGAPDGLLQRVGGGIPLVADETRIVAAAVRDLRVLDPACGSGAFLLHVVERLARIRQATGDHRPLSAIRRDVVTRNVFGVDVNPTAVWLCELRLWLSLVIDHPATGAADVPPLPNLDHNIRCGDTLLGGDFSLSAGVPGARVRTLRSRYARATGVRKRLLAHALEREERAGLLGWLDARLEQVAAQRRSLVTAARGHDLFGRRRGSVAGEREEAAALRMTARELRARRRAVWSGGALPFAFAAHFPDAAAAGGFDVIVGNPPWIRLHHIPVSMRQSLRRDFRVYREAAWLAGTKAARAGTGFGSQVDAASLFVERSYQLLRDDGVLSLLVPSKLWRSLAGGGVRRLLTDRATLVHVEDWSGAPALFDAATYPSLLVAARSSLGDPCVGIAVHRGTMQVSWRAPRASVPLDDSAGAPWLVLPPDARAAFDRLARSGIALAESGLGTATLGVKCGCNAAFLVRAHDTSPGVEVTDGARTGLVERGFVRRVLRGESVRAWRAAASDECLVFPHGPDGRAVERLPPLVRRWLLPWRRRLEARADARGNHAWWSLFRLEGSRCDRPRVVWADLGRSLQALVLEAGDESVPLNTCYVLPTRDLVDALALAALLNSPLADAWVGALAEPARGGYRRHFAWTMARLPVPDDWARARDVLAPLGDRGVTGRPPSRAELLGAALDAFRLRHRSVAPLLEWMIG